MLSSFERALARAISPDTRRGRRPAAPTESAESRPMKIEIPQGDKPNDRQEPTEDRPTIASYDITNIDGPTTIFHEVGVDPYEGAFIVCENPLDVGGDGR